jgi:tRNA pseudouridine55 synthase
LGYDIAKKLGFEGALTYLERTKEGKFQYECEKPLNPIEFLKIPQNFYLNDPKNLILGKKLDIKDFEIQKSGIYYVKYDNYFAIIELGENVKYILNRIGLC